MYDNLYPRDTSRANQAAMQRLARALPHASTADSTKRLLHELISRSLKARLLEQGLRYCTQLKQVDPEEVGAYFASGYAYTQQAKWRDPVKTDSKLRYSGWEVTFELMERAIAKRGVPPVEVEVGVEIVGYIQSGLVETDKCAAVGQQLSFKRAPTGLGIIVGL